MSWDELILEPYKYLARNGGQEFRTNLMSAFNEWLDICQEKFEQISEIIRLLHNSSLIIDDIEDGSLVRRGQPAAHCVYGVPTSINSANFVYFLALQKVLELGHPDAVKVFTEQMITLHRGQGKDILWRAMYQCPSETEYREMVIEKTGGLFGLGVRLMQLFSDNKTDFKPLLDNLGILFQIRDDYINLFNTKYHKTKSFAEDLTEGKFSYPLIRAINDHPQDHQVVNILFQRPTDVHVKRQCIKRVVELGSGRACVDALAQLEADCFHLIDRFGGNKALASFVNRLGSTYRSDDGSLVYPSITDGCLKASSDSLSGSEAAAANDNLHHSSKALHVSSTNRIVTPTWSLANGIAATTSSTIRNTDTN